MSKHLNRLSNLLLLCLGSVCQLEILRSSFSCTVEPSLWVFLLLSCVLLWVSASYRRGIWIGMPLSAALLFVAARFYHSSPSLELQDLIDRISGAFYTHITHPGVEYPYANLVQSHSFVLLLLGFFLAAYLSTALHSRGLRISLVFLETITIFTACVMVNGSMPALASLGMILFWFLVLAGGKGFQPGGKGYRTVFCCAIPIALLLAVLLQMHRPDQYEYTPYDRSLTERFEHYADFFDLLAGRSSEDSFESRDSDQQSETPTPRSSFQSSWDADDDSMRLNSAYDESLQDQRIMEVRAEKTGRLYLRTASYGDYTGTGWAPAEDLNSGSSLPFTAFAAEASPESVRRQVEIHTFVDLKALCIPYYAAVSSGSDSMVSPEQQISYRITYVDYPGSIWNLKIPEQAAGAEEQYRSYAHSTYTRLPDKTRNAAWVLLAQAGLKEDDPQIIQKVASFVQSNGEYDLQTQAYPSDDYAIYFLTEAHRGYCIHYASAAAVLYRALGIPARVTEGFAAPVRAGLFTDVHAGDAHAWVEIYLDGIGWIPVEVTMEARFATETAAPPSPEPVPEPSDQPEESAPPSEMPGGGPTENPEGPSGDGGDGPGGGGGSGFPWKAILIPLAILLLIALWYPLRRAFVLGQLRQRDSRKAAVASWRYAKRAASFGGEIPEEITQPAEKAAFSLHAVRQEELADSITALQVLIDSVYPDLKPLPKFLFRFLFGLK